MQAPDPSTSAAKGDAGRGAVPATLAHPAARRFWLAVVLIGIGAGAGAAALTFALTTVQHWVWPPANVDLLQAAAGAGFWRHVIILTGAGVVTGIRQILLVNLPAGNSNEKIGR